MNLCLICGLSIKLLVWLQVLTPIWFQEVKCRNQPRLIAVLLLRCWMARPRYPIWMQNQLKRELTFRHVIWVCQQLHHIVVHLNVSLLSLHSLLAALLVGNAYCGLEIVWTKSIYHLQESRLGQGLITYVKKELLRDWTRIITLRFRKVLPCGWVFSGIFIHKVDPKLWQSRNIGNIDLPILE